MCYYLGLLLCHIILAFNSVLLSWPFTVSYYFGLLLCPIILAFYCVILFWSFTVSHYFGILLCHIILAFSLLHIILAFYCPLSRLFFRENKCTVFILSLVNDKKRAKNLSVFLILNVNVLCDDI